MTEPPSTQPDLIVGIDLGTTNSLIAYSDDAGPRVLGGDDDIVPSAVRYEDDGTVVVGKVALAEAPLHPESTLTSVKRLVGRSIDDASGDLKYLGYRVIAGENQTARVALPNGRTVTPEEVSAEVLRELKKRAELALGAPVNKAVVTVPAYFDDAQRQATRNAGRLSGLEVVRIVNEPTAAALAYGIGAGSDRGVQTVAVYDLGGGTFDVSILRLTPGEEGGPDFFQVLSTAGDTRLGGDDIDHAIMALFAAEIGVELGRDSDDPLSGLPIETRRALHQFARAVKHRLSEQEQAAIEVSLGTDHVYRRTLTRAELEELIAPIVERSITACDRAMRDAKRAMGSGSIDAVIMVGGSTRIPLVRERVGAFFGIEPYTALDPDRIVALGASVQASIIAGTNSGGLLLDVIPLSLGIETAGGAVAKLVVRNTTVPTRATERFSTSVDGQTNIKLNILQGEREMAEDCRTLGVFELRGIPPMPAGIPKLVVEFLVDANGVLRVSANEERSGKRASVQVVPNHGLTESEVERIEADSLTHAREDMSRHRVADLITNSELDLKWIGERLAKHRDALDPAYRDELDGMIDRLRGMVERAKADWSSVEPNAFYAAKTELDEASVRLQEVSIAASLRED